MERFGFWSILMIVFIAELPCLLRTMCIQMHNKSMWEVITGTMTGNILALVIGVLLAKFVQSSMPLGWIEYIEKGASILLIALGFYLLLSCNHHHD